MPMPSVALCLAAIVLMWIVAPSQLPASETSTPSVAWRTDYEEAHREAMATGRPLLVSMDRHNCGWCRELDRHVYTDETMLAIIEERFIPVRPTGTHRRALVEQHQVNAVPWTLVLTASQTPVLVHQQRGYVHPSNFEQFLRQAHRRHEQYAESADGLALLNESMTAYIHEDFQQSLRLATQLLETAGDHSEGYRLRSMIHHATGDLPQALQDGQKAAQYAPEDGLVDLQLGHVYFDMGHYASAQRAYYHAVEKLGHASQDAAIRLWISSILVGKGSEATDFLRSYRLNVPGRSGMQYEQMQLDYCLGLLSDLEIMGQGELMRWRLNPVQETRSRLLIAVRHAGLGDHSAALEQLDHIHGLKPMPRLADYRSSMILRDRLHTLTEQK